jgi:hypothetical protein
MLKAQVQAMKHSLHEAKAMTLHKKISNLVIANDKQTTRLKKIAANAQAESNQAGEELRREQERRAQLEHELHSLRQVKLRHSAHDNQARRAADEQYSALQEYTAKLKRQMKETILDGALCRIVYLFRGHHTLSASIAMRKWRVASLSMATEMQQRSAERQMMEQKRKEEDERQKRLYEEETHREEQRRREDEDLQRQRMQEEEKQRQRQEEEEWRRRREQEEMEQRRKHELEQMQRRRREQEEWERRRKEEEEKQRERWQLERETLEQAQAAEEQAQARAAEEERLREEAAQARWREETEARLHEEARLQEEAAQARWREETEARLQEESEAREAALAIQKVHRGKNARRASYQMREEKDAREGALAIQKVYRGKNARRASYQMRIQEEQDQKDAAVAIQKIHRGKIERRTSIRMMEERHREEEEREQKEAALAIQKVHRGKNARRASYQMREEKDAREGALAIQKVYRGKRSRSSSPTNRRRIRSGIGGCLALRFLRATCKTRGGANKQKRTRVRACCGDLVLLSAESFPGEPEHYHTAYGDTTYEWAVGRQRDSQQEEAVFEIPTETLNSTEEELVFELYDAGSSPDSLGRLLALAQTPLLPTLSASSNASNSNGTMTSASVWVERRLHLQVLDPNQPAGLLVVEAQWLPEPAAETVPSPPQRQPQYEQQDDQQHSSYRQHQAPPVPPSIPPPPQNQYQRQQSASQLVLSSQSHCLLQNVWGGSTEARFGMYIGVSERSDVLQLFSGLDTGGNDDGYSGGDGGRFVGSVVGVSGAPNAGAVGIGRWRFARCEDEHERHGEAQHYYLQNVWGDGDTNAGSMAADDADPRAGMWVGLAGTSLILHPRESEGGMFGDRARWKLLPCPEDTSNDTYMVQNVWGGEDEHR